MKPHLLLACLLASPFVAHALPHVHDAEASPIPAAAGLTTLFAARPTTAAELTLWPSAERARQEALETDLIAAVDAAQLREWHDRLAGEAHPAGSPGDERVIESLANLFTSFGLEVEVHPFWTYLAAPVSARVAILGDTPIELPLKERPVEGDPDSGEDGLTFGWNAYSGSGSVEGEIVYANQGRLEDFAELERLGVDCRGKIVVARYGGNYRGYKAKYAEEAGAAGLLIYTDPKDSGWGRGLPYPEGGFANETSIQRGSIKVLPYDGDPLTPGVEATRAAERLNATEVALPRIPVQPLGWGAARQILERMRGASAPQAWQGGLDFRYRLTGGPELRVALEVQQDRRLVRTANVIGTLRGERSPEQSIVLGAHHDAWSHGAADPTSGTITVVEAARVLGALAKEGRRPARTIRFAGWGAEEHGIIGSVEWVESRTRELREECVAYFNMDMAATGPNFRSAASPDLQALVAAVARRVPQGEADEEPRAIARWAKSGEPSFGDLGGGSDHVGFIARAGVPCASLTAGGSPGSSYHSLYDTLAWYRQVVGEDYGSARLVARMAATCAARLANAPVLELRPSQMGRDTVRHLQRLSARGRALGLFASESAEIADGAAGAQARDTTEAGTDALLASAREAALREFEIASELAPLGHRALVFVERATPLEGRLAREAEALDGARRRQIDALLIACGRAWLDERGLPGRPWYQNLFAAPDETSGYAAWMLPLLRKTIEDGGGERLADALTRYERVFDQLEARLDSIEALLGEPPVATGAATGAATEAQQNEVDSNSNEAGGTKETPMQEETRTIDSLAIDELWNWNDPAATEEAFLALVPRVEAQGDPALLAELRSQVARTHSIRGTFDDAHRILDEAEAALAEAQPDAAPGRARIRLWLERGRTFRSAGKAAEAIEPFERALELALDRDDQFFALDAAHMLAITGSVEDMLAGGERALELADRCTDERARGWLGPIYNNCGQTYLDLERYEDALAAFTKGLEFRRSRGGDLHIARWSVAHTKRKLGRVEEALAEQEALLAECEERGEPDGFVFEELAECLHALGRKDEARPYFARAHEMLAKIGWVAQDAARLERLKTLGSDE